MRRGLLAALAVVVVGVLTTIMTNASADVCCVTRVSLGDDGRQGNGDTHFSDFAPRAKVHAFASGASNLVRGDTNANTDIFVRFQRGSRARTERVSVGPGGRQADSWSINPVSDDRGVVIGFTSNATNLVDAPDATPDKTDVFVRNRRTGRTELVSVSSSGAQSNGGGQVREISADGRFVLFDSAATNLVDGVTDGVAHLYLRDRTRGTTELVDRNANGQPADGGTTSSMSRDVRFIAFFAGDGTGPGDANGVRDVFLRDRQTGTTELVSLAADGTPSNSGSTLYHQGTQVSTDGRYVVFESDATNLVPGDTNSTYDVFVRDRGSNTTERVSVSATGEQGNRESFFPMIAGDRDRPVVAFLSHATNLGGTGVGFNLYVRDHRTNTIELVTSGVDIRNLDPTGCVVSYTAGDPQLPDDTNGFRDAFTARSGIGC